MQVTDQMVNNFLAWRLPQAFAPDNGISFTPPAPVASGFFDGWPIGTNLLTAAEARAMLEHVLAQP